MSQKRPVRPAIALLTFIGVCAGLCFVPGVLADNSPSKLIPVEPRVGDLGGLSTSQRWLPMDLRVPLNFERVYRVPGSASGPRVPGSNGDGFEDRYARVSGGITAVFPRSEYIDIPTKKGEVTITAVPPGTVFYIGQSWLDRNGLDQTVPKAQPLREAFNAVHSVVDQRVPAISNSAIRSALLPVGFVNQRNVPLGESFPVLRQDRAQPKSGMLTDETYRRARVRELLVKAARQV